MQNNVYKAKRNYTWLFFSIGMFAVFAYSFGYAFVLEKEPNVWIILGIVFFLILGPVFLPFIKKSRLKKRLAREGLPATARLLQTRQTGTQVNDQPEMILTMQVTAETGETWQTEMREIIPMNMLYAMAPGSIFNVLYNPNDKSQIVFDNTGNTRASTNSNTDPNTAQQAFMDLVEKQELLYKRLSVSGIQAKAKVLAYTPLGAHFNGNNPLVLLMLQVQPENGTAFHGQTYAVIGEAGVPKYQPGNTIFVKFDATDNSQIVVTGSDKPDTSVRI